MTEPLLQVQDLSKTYTVSRGMFGSKHTVAAVNGVSFSIDRGETLGLVGESGSGKSTIGRLALRLEEPTSGHVRFCGQDLSALSAAQLRLKRRQMQMVFQNPYGALNPRMTAGAFVQEPLVIHRTHSNAQERADYVASLFQLVGLDPSFARRYPHEFSGGQRQRIVIARAIALKPQLIVADEPITALDVSIQAQIVNLLQDLRERLGLTYLFISHDLSMVRYLCQRVAVMLRGRLVEVGSSREIFESPSHAYTQSLLSAIPLHDPVLERQRRRVAPNLPEIERSLHGTYSQVGPTHFVLQPTG